MLFIAEKASFTNAASFPKADNDASYLTEGCKSNTIKEDTQVIDVPKEDTDDNEDKVLDLIFSKTQFFVSCSYRIAELQ